MSNTNEYTYIPTQYDIYKEVATGIPSSDNEHEEWVLITNFKNSSEEDNALPEPNSNTGNWYLNTESGKVAYEGIKKEDGYYYYTPSEKGNEALKSENAIGDSVLTNNY